eukprot:m.1201460 g.1201460  ORF g.1201460 m.1201460 type:complete len:696 (+) comp24575_c0_seq12:64-2151(+)
MTTKGLILLGAMCALLHQVTTAHPLRDSDSSCPPEPFRTALFKALNASYPGLAAYAAAIQRNDVEGACDALAKYYEDANTDAWLRHATVPPSNTYAQAADAVLQDHYTYYGVSAVVPRLPSGRLDWNFSGPNHDVQWSLALNRHFQFGTLTDAWLATGNATYAAFLDALVEDWITFAGLPPQGSSKYPPEEYYPDWVLLDAGIRMGVWPIAFFGMQNSSTFRRSTLLLMAASSAIHAEFLTKYTVPTSNWVATIAYGLASTAIAFPEFTASSTWYNVGLTRAALVLHDGVYPDGVETEMTAHYHAVAANSLDKILEVCILAEADVPKSFKGGVEGMFNYLAYTMDSKGFAPLNGDSDLDNNTALIVEQSRVFNRSDWLFLATGGAQGVLPEGPSSTMFTWAGQIIMRNQWPHEKAAGTTDTTTWMWFSIGPFGSSGHAHMDKLHLSLRAFGLDFLVDSGRFAYEGDMAVYLHTYAALTQGHNVVMLNGKQQVKTPAVAQGPVPASAWNITDAYDAVCGNVSFDGLTAADDFHARSIHHERGEFFVVLDRMYSRAAAATMETFWHVHPNVTTTWHAPSSTLFLQSKFGSEGVTMVSSLQQWENVSIVRGQTKPVLQGWYSPTYSEKHPNDAAIFTRSINSGSTYMAWVILPSRSGLEHATVTVSSIDSDGNGAEVTVHYNTTSGPSDVKTIHMKLC